MKRIVFSCMMVMLLVAAFFAPRVQNAHASASHQNRPHSCGSDFAEIGASVDGVMDAGDDVYSEAQIWTDGCGGIREKLVGEVDGGCIFGSACSAPYSLYGGMYLDGAPYTQESYVSCGLSTDGAYHSCNGSYVYPGSGCYYVQSFSQDVNNYYHTAQTADRCI